MGYRMEHPSKQEAKNQEPEGESCQRIKPEGIIEEAKKLEESKTMRIGRSVSLSRSDQKRKEPKTPPSPPKAKRDKIQSPSPKKKGIPEGINVRAKKATYEQTQEKYRKQRTIKEKRQELKREKKTKPATPEKVEDPITKLLKEMKSIGSDMREIKSDLKSNNSKIDGLQTKIDKIESEAKFKDNLNQKKFEEIKGELTSLEASVTRKIVGKIQPTINLLKDDLQANIQSELTNMKNEIQPSISNLKNELQANLADQVKAMREENREADEEKMRKIVSEQLAVLLPKADAEPRDDEVENSSAADEDTDNNAEKNKRSKKRKKAKNQKKLK